MKDQDWGTAILNPRPHTPRYQRLQGKPYKYISLLLTRINKTFLCKVQELYTSTTLVFLDVWLYEGM